MFHCQNSIFHHHRLLGLLLHKINFLSESGKGAWKAHGRGKQTIKPRKGLGPPPPKNTFPPPFVHALSFSLEEETCTDQTNPTFRGLQNWFLRARSKVRFPLPKSHDRFCPPHLPFPNLSCEISHEKCFEFSRTCWAVFFFFGSHLLNPVTINPVIRMSCLGPVFCPRNSKAFPNSEPGAYNLLFRSAECPPDKAPQGPPLRGQTPLKWTSDRTKLLLVFVRKNAQDKNKILSGSKFQPSALNIQALFF